MPDARSGTIKPVRRDPPHAAIWPVIHKRTEPPSPLTAKTHRDSDGRLVTASTRERHRGKMGASISPASIALVMLIDEVRLTISSRLLHRSRMRDMVSSRASEIFFRTAGAMALPIRSAIQKNDVATGAMRILDICRRRTYVIIQLLMEASTPTYKNANRPRGMS